MTLYFISFFKSIYIYIIHYVIYIYNIYIYIYIHIILYYIILYYIILYYIILYYIILYTYIYYDILRILQYGTYILTLAALPPGNASMACCVRILGSGAAHFRRLILIWSRRLMYPYRPTSREAPTSVISPFTGGMSPSTGGNFTINWWN